MKKIDFVMLISVENCNPNGDPLNEGRPRTNLAGHGEISAECIKRKIRNRFQDMGCPIFVQSEYRANDEFKSLHERACSIKEISDAFKENNKVVVEETACSIWSDVRLFGQLFAFSGGVSVGIRGAVSICHATSIHPISVKDIAITKSVNSEPSKKGGGKSSDTMGCKSIVEYGVYVVKGSINPFMAEKNHVTQEDIETFKKSLCTLFENDESSSRPSGSMSVTNLFWFEQDKNNYISSSQIHSSVTVCADNSVSLIELPSSIQVKQLI